jgi:hypothetical protein
MPQKLVACAFAIALSAAMACGKSSAPAGPSDAQCAAAVDHWMLMESQIMGDSVSDKALANDSDAVRAAARKSFDEYQAVGPKRRAAMVGNCVAAKWKPPVLQCMNAVQKEGTSFCEDLMGAGYDVAAAPAK